MFWLRSNVLWKNGPSLFGRQQGELSCSQEVEVFESIRLPIAFRFDAAICKFIWVSIETSYKAADFGGLLFRIAAARFSFSSN